MNSFTINNITYPVVKLSDDIIEKNVIYFWEKGDEKDPFFKCQLCLDDDMILYGIGKNDLLEDKEYLLLDALNDLSYYVSDYQKQIAYWDYLTQLATFVSSLQKVSSSEPNLDIFIETLGGFNVYLDENDLESSEILSALDAITNKLSMINIQTNVELVSEVFKFLDNFSEFIKSF